MQKNLMGLGNYIGALVHEKGGGNWNQTAKRLGVSAAELSALRNGGRKNPSPHILGKIAEELEGDYAMMMQLAGYEVPTPFYSDVTALPILENVTPDKALEQFVVGRENVSRCWLCDRGYGYFWYREESAVGGATRLLLVRVIDEWQDGDIVVASVWGEPAVSRYIFHHAEQIELLSQFDSPKRTIAEPDDVKVYGIVIRMVVIFEASKR